MMTPQKWVDATGAISQMKALTEDHRMLQLDQAKEAES